MNTRKTVDLGDLGLNMAFYGMMTAIVLFVLAVVSEIIFSVAVNADSSDLRCYSIAAVIWLAFNAKHFIMLTRLRTSGVSVENRKNKVRIFESVVTGFIWAYGLFFFYFPFDGNADPDALNKFFE